MFPKTFPYMVEGERVRITSPQPSLFLLSVWKEAGEQTSVELDVNSRPSLLPSLTTVEPCESCRACPNIYKHSPGALPTWLCGQIHWKRLGGGGADLGEPLKFQISTAFVEAIRPTEIFLEIPHIQGCSSGHCL